MRRTHILASLAVVVSLSGCRAMFRYPALEPDLPVDDATIASGINLDLVGESGAKTIVFEVHWVEGYRPTDYALDGLHEALRRVAPEKSVTIEMDPAPTPRAEWEATGDDPGAADLWVERHARDVEPAEGTFRIQVLYIPDGRKWFDWGFFGMAGRAAVERPDGSFVAAPVIFMATEPIVKASVLWLAPKRSERSTLVHEFGHLLGITRNPRHVKRDDGFHCTEPQCVMGAPTARKIAYNLPRGLFTGTIPTWYCGKCMGDLQAARRWAAAERAAGRDPLAGTARTERVQTTRHAVAALVRRGREDEAKERLDALLAEVPYHEDYYELAIALWSHGWYAQAQRLFEAVVREAPPGSRGASEQYVLELLQAQGRYEAAIARNTDVAFSHVRQEALSALGRHEEAIAAARAAVAAEHPKHITPWLEASVAGALSDAGRFDEALETLRGTWSGREPTPRERLAEGEMLLDAGRPDQAREAFRGVLDAVGGSPEKSGSPYEVRIPAARAHAHLGDEKAARAALCGSQRCKPTGWTRTELARLLVILGDEAGAMEALLQARTEGGVTRLNPCVDRDLEALRDDPRFAEHFPCAPRAEE